MRSPRSLAGTVALVQPDIKRVLAYSTVSQLGYMFLAVGVGAYTAAVFIVLVHAFYKGWLFLGAGSVIHGNHDNQDMRIMGRVAQVHADTPRAPSSSRWLAIAGMPPLVGLLVQGRDHQPGVLRATTTALWIVGIVAAGVHRLLHDPR